MLFTILIWALLALGSAVLTALIIKLVELTVKFFITKIREYLSARMGTRVIGVAIKELVKEIEKEKDKKKNVTKLTELEKMLGDNGVVLAAQDVNGNIVEDSIKPYSAQRMDQQISDIMNQNDGIVIFEE